MPADPLQRWLKQARQVADTAKQAAQSAGDELRRRAPELQERATTQATRLASTAGQVLGDLGERARTGIDALLEEGEDIGERFHREVTEAYVIDEGWAGEQAQRIATRLNGLRFPNQPLIPVVVWSGQVTACAIEGRYIYLTRELQQRMPDDDPVAFVLAHEMAHHDLGHVTYDTRVGRRLPPLPDAIPLRMAIELGAHFAMRPEFELDADAMALMLCLDAGYDGERCLGALDVLERHLLDHGDLDSVFGADSAPHEDDRWAPWREWWRERQTGYASIYERRKRLRELLGSR